MRKPTYCQAGAGSELLVSIIISAAGKPWFDYGLNAVLQGFVEGQTPHSYTGDRQLKETFKAVQCHSFYIVDDEGS